MFTFHVRTKQEFPGVAIWVQPMASSHIETLFSTQVSMGSFTKRQCPLLWYHSLNVLIYLQNLNLLKPFLEVFMFSIIFHNNNFQKENCLTYLSERASLKIHGSPTVIKYLSLSITLARMDWLLLLRKEIDLFILKTPCTKILFFFLQSYQRQEQICLVMLINTFSQGYQVKWKFPGAIPKSEDSRKLRKSTHNE